MHICVAGRINVWVRRTHNQQHLFCSFKREIKFMSCYMCACARVLEFNGLKKKLRLSLSAIKRTLIKKQRCLMLFNISLYFLFKNLSVNLNIPTKTEIISFL